MGTKLSSLIVKGKKLERAQTLDKSHAGKTFFLNSTTEFAVTLPKPVIPGMEYEFIVTGAPSGDSYTITTNGGSDIILGQVVTNDVNSVTDADYETSGADTITFADGVAVVGDKVHLISDGTYWYATGKCSVYNAITFTTT